MCLSPMSPHPLGEETLATSTDSIAEFSGPQLEPSATSAALHARSGDGAATSLLLPPGGMRMLQDNRLPDRPSHHFSSRALFPLAPQKFKELT
jgi:hypothetical protein